MQTFALNELVGKTVVAVSLSDYYTELIFMFNDGTAQMLETEIQESQGIGYTEGLVSGFRQVLNLSRLVSHQIQSVTTSVVADPEGLPDEYAGLSYCYVSITTSAGVCNIGFLQSGLDVNSLLLTTSTPTTQSLLTADFDYIKSRPKVWE